MKNIITIVCFLIAFCECYFAQGGGNALLFDGIDDYVDFGSSQVFNVDSAVTYEAWIRLDTSATGFILNKWVSFYEDKFIFISAGFIHFYLYNVFSFNPLISASTIQINQYTHIAATFNGNIAKLFINGVLDTSKSVSNYPGNSSGILFAGFNPDRSDAVYPFKGVIDELRIWNTARTEEEIQSTMNQELIGNESGLVGYWNFNEGIGSITADQTSNGNDGTISGATWVISGIFLPVEYEFDLPDEYTLTQNYPNPFNPSTVIGYQLPVSSNVSLKVYDLLGREVATLVDEFRPAGSHEVEYNAAELTSGIYYYTLIAGNYSQTKKMILLK